MSRGDRVEVLDRGRWRPTVVESQPGYGWMLVAGWPDRAGPVSVCVENTRMEAPDEHR